MIPMRHSTIFKSRWMALLWSAGIIWFAIDIAGGKPDNAANSSGNATAASDDDALNIAEFGDTRRLVDQLGAR